MQPKHAIWFVVFCLHVFQSNAEGISCFKCVGRLRPGNLEREHCSHFDGSASFQVFCPASTFCMKKTVHYTLPNGTSIATTEERDCAPQKYSYQDYDFNEHTWHYKEEVVKTAYEEGCFTGEDRKGPVGPSEYCFCSFHLCNASNPIKTGDAFSIFLTTIVLLLCAFSTEYFTVFELHTLSN